MNNSIPLVRKYNKFNTQARSAEQQADWKFAAKMWRHAAEIADKQGRKAALQFCDNRYDFCQGMARRAGI